MEFYEAVRKRWTVREFLGVPAGCEIAAVIPFGYPKEPPGENEVEDLDAWLHIDGWLS